MASTWSFTLQEPSLYSQKINFGILLATKYVYSNYTLWNGKMTTRWVWEPIDHTMRWIEVKKPLIT